MNKREIVTKYENTIYAIIATDEVLKDLKQLDEMCIRDRIIIFLMYTTLTN